MLLHMMVGKAMSQPLRYLGRTIMKQRNAYASLALDSAAARQLQFTWSHVEQPAASPARFLNFPCSSPAPAPRAARRSRMEKRPLAA